MKLLCKTCRRNIVKNCILHSEGYCYFYSPNFKSKIVKFLSKFNPRKAFTFQGAVQYFENKPAICGDSIKWFAPITYSGWFWQESKYEKIALDYYKNNYQDVKDFIAMY